MYGLEGAGKTTFLYKLKIPQWKKAEIKKEMKTLKEKDDKLIGFQESLDPSYHYEELYSQKLGHHYGIWDIPGKDVFEHLWPMFYRYNRIAAVIFVVDCFSEGRANLDGTNLGKLFKARRLMHFLFHEDELRTAAFILVLNIDLAKNSDKRNKSSRQAGEEDAQAKDKEDLYNAYYDMLGVPEIEQSKQSHRFHKAEIDCSNVCDKDEMSKISQEKWDMCLTKVKDVYKTFGDGSVAALRSDG